MSWASFLLAPLILSYYLINLFFPASSNEVRLQLLVWTSSQLYYCVNFFLRILFCHYSDNLFKCSGATDVLFYGVVIIELVKSWIFKCLVV